MFTQADVICVLNRDIMTSDSHYCESLWYLGIGRNILVSPFYTRYLHVVINRRELTGPGFPLYMDMVGIPSLSFR